MTKQAAKENRPAERVEPNSINWRDFDPSWLPGGERSPLAAELTTYRDHLDELLKDEGKFVVIKGESVLGVYPDRKTALAAALKAYGKVSLLVKKIVEMEPARRLVNVVL